MKGFAGTAPRARLGKAAKAIKKAWGKARPDFLLPDGQISASELVLPECWQRRYGHAVHVAETFVDVACFAGTCYRAANWQCVGETRGHAKRGHLYLPHGMVKRIYLYPLTRHWRERLTSASATA